MVGTITQVLVLHSRSKKNEKKETEERRKFLNYLKSFGLLLLTRFVRLALKGILSLL